MLQVRSDVTLSTICWQGFSSFLIASSFSGWNCGVELECIATHLNLKCSCHAHSLMRGFTKALEREDTDKAASCFHPRLPFEPVFTFAPKSHQDLDIWHSPATVRLQGIVWLGQSQKGRRRPKGGQFGEALQSQTENRSISSTRQKKKESLPSNNKTLALWIKLALRQKIDWTHSCGLTLHPARIIVVEIKLQFLSTRKNSQLLPKICSGGSPNWINTILFCQVTHCGRLCRLNYGVIILLFYN